MRRNRFQDRLEQLPEGRREHVLDIAERLVERGVDEDRALFEALRHEFRRERTRPDAEVPSADVSLGKPHGPEGESHGGRDGRDPLQVTQESTPGPQGLGKRRRRLRREKVAAHNRSPKGARSASERRRRT